MRKPLMKINRHVYQLLTIEPLLLRRGTQETNCFDDQRRSSKILSNLRF